MEAGQFWKRLVGWGLVAWGIVQALSFLIGLPGVPEDLKTWGTSWLPTAWKWMSALPMGLSAVISLLLLAVGIWLLARERFEPIPTWYRHGSHRIRSLWRRTRAEPDESPPTTEDEGELAEHEVAALQVVAQHVNEPDEGITPFDFQQKMAQRGFSGTDGTLALASLRERGMLERFEHEDWNGDLYTQYRLTSLGARWLNSNRPRLAEVDDIPF